MKLMGVIPASILPLDAELEIDEAAYRQHIRSLASSAGVTAITCNGHAGEVTSLSRGERSRVVALTAETVAGRMPVVAGVYAENHRDAVSGARDAQRNGADALLIFPPSILAYDAAPDVAFRHFAEIASAVQLPLIAFEYPAWTGLQYDVDSLVSICEIPAVVAVKEWSLDIRVHERNWHVLQSLDPPVALLSSFSTNLLPALVSGADGILSGHGSVIAILQAELLDAVQAARLSEAQALYRRIQHLTALIYRSPMANMYARMKEQLIMLGFELTPAVRPPLTPVTDKERRELRQALVSAQVLPANT